MESDCYAATVLNWESGFPCRALELEESERLANENIKDIIAVGFDPENTFIFTDFQYVGGEFYRNMIRIQR